jgi:glutamate mutase epsilon subunit
MDRQKSLCQLGFGRCRAASFGRTAVVANRTAKSTKRLLSQWSGEATNTGVAEARAAVREIDAPLAPTDGCPTIRSRLEP